MNDLMQQTVAEQAIATTILEQFVGKDWALARASYGQVGSAGMASLVGEAVDGSKIGPRPPWGGLREQLAALREQMHVPGKGTWFSCFVDVKRDGSYVFDFNYDRPIDLTARPLRDMIVSAPSTGPNAYPGVADYLADLERFPRSAEFLPSWFPGAGDVPAPVVPSVEFASALSASVTVPAPVKAAVAVDPAWAGIVSAVSDAVVESIRGMTDPVFRELMPGGGSDRWELLEPVEQEVWERVMDFHVYPLSVGEVESLARALDPSAAPVGSDVDRSVAVRDAGDAVAQSDAVRRVQGTVAELITQQFADRFSLPR